MERISRKDDENLYQPQIHSKRIRQLYKLSQLYNLPLTVMVDMAIGEYIKQLTEANDEERNPNQ
jgi:hypothetical protein